MKIPFNRSIALALLALGALFLYGVRNGTSAFSPASGTAVAQEAGTEKAVFKVKCYDEGKAALQGMQGVRKIETGFHYIHETDTVYYDPKVITVEQMEAALKRAGTYVETISGKERK